MLPVHNDIELRTAHDVRHIRKCESCTGMGDKRRMLTGLEAAGLAPGFHHGRCVVQVLSVAQVLQLPAAQRAKLTLGDTGPELMRKLMDAGDREFKVV